MMMLKKFLLSLLFCFPTASFGQALFIDPSELRTPEDKASVSVVQQRFFWKKWRPEIGAVIGTVLNDPYSKITTRGLRFGLFFTESIGIDVEHLLTINSDSEDRRIIKEQKFRPLEKPQNEDADNETAYPDIDVNDIHSFTDYALVIAPFYGKINLINNLIVYTDMYLSLGMTQVSTLRGDLSGYLIGVGQKFNFLKSWSFRLDLRNRTFTEDRKVGGNTTETTTVKFEKNSFHIDLGISYFFL